MRGDGWRTQGAGGCGGTVSNRCRQAKHIDGDCRSDKAGILARKQGHSQASYILVSHINSCSGQGSRADFTSANHRLAASRSQRSQHRLGTEIFQIKIWLPFKTPKNSNYTRIGSWECRAIDAAVFDALAARNRRISNWSIVKILSLKSSVV